MRVFEWAGVALSRGGDDSVRLFNLSRINNTASSKTRGSGGGPRKKQPGHSDWGSSWKRSDVGKRCCRKASESGAGASLHLLQLHGL